MMSEVWERATAELSDEELNVATTRMRESFLEEKEQGLFDHLDLDDSSFSYCLIQTMLLSSEAIIRRKQHFQLAIHNR